MHLVQQLNNAALWSHPNPSQCPCGGRGWLLSDYDTWHACNVHGRTPYPEDEEGHEGFDWEAHDLRIHRRAYRTFQEASGLDRVAFRAEVMRRVEAGATLSRSRFVDAANEVAHERTQRAEDEEARRCGYSCAMEMRMEEWAEEERVERMGYGGY